MRATWKPIPIGSRGWRLSIVLRDKTGLAGFEVYLGITYPYSCLEFKNVFKYFDSKSWFCSSGLAMAFCRIRYRVRTTTLQWL